MHITEAMPMNFIVDVHRRLSFFGFCIHITLRYTIFIYFFTLSLISMKVSIIRIFCSSLIKIIIVKSVRSLKKGSRLPYGIPFMAVYLQYNTLRKH